MKFILSLILVISFTRGDAQELYVFTEPASNMAANSIGVRFVSRLFKMTHDNKFSSYRLEPEVMIGVNKNLMVHVNVYASDMFQRNLKMEGAALYAKYRILSKDDIHSHFRMAVYGKIAVIDNPTALITTEKHVIPDGSGGVIIHDLIHTTVNNEIELDGANSGISTGVIATQLLNKLAISGSAGYSYRLNNLRDKREVIVPWHAVNYSLSAGYLLFPKEYTSYRQTNINLYAEFLGTSTWENKKYYLDMAPAIQFIINSIARIDIGYRTQLSGNTLRMANSNFLMRVEYNFLNVFSKK
ncbi:MAG TPA: hypothetical protein VK489_06900 [Ferruginibacter sp.]|nr:hypothetical protein [Ferruginibacter sp.]